MTQLPEQNRQPLVVNQELLERFLAKLAETGRIIESAKKAGMSYGVLDKMRKSSPEVEEAVQRARLEYSEKLAAAAHERGCEGIKEPILDKDGNHIKDGEGKLMYRVVYSDRLLLALLKAYNPDFQEKTQVDVNLSGGMAIVPMTARDASEWERRHKDKTVG